MRLFRTCSRPLTYFVLAAASVPAAYAQTAQEAALSQAFEGKQVIVKMDMPATQKGVDIRLGKAQPLDTKSYGDRLKQFGTALRNGDSVLVTKVKVKNDSVEFQLGGGGYGTAGDMTDGSVHFTPAEKSSHEKELEDQLNKETDEARRRSLSRELDDLRRDRERQDRRDQAAAQRDADYRRDKIASSRLQGGSRFNIRLDKRSAEALTPQLITEVLSPYLSFSPEPAGDRSSGYPSVSSHPDPGGPPAPPTPPAAPTDGAANLRKGLTRAQVDALYGPAAEAHDHSQGGMTVTTCTYRTASQSLEADFVNGVLVQYRLASR